MKKKMLWCLLIACWFMLASPYPGAANSFNDWFSKYILNGIPSDWDPMGKYVIQPIEEAVPNLSLTGMIRMRMVHMTDPDSPFGGTKMQNAYDPRMWGVVGNGLPPAGGPFPPPYQKRSKIAPVKFHISNWEWLFDLEATYRFSNNVSATIIHYFNYDGAYDIDPGVHHFFHEWSGPVWQEWHYYHTYERIMREAYVDIQGAPNPCMRWKWRLGKQQVTWGRVDGGRVMDIINPEDLREGPQHAGDDWRYYKLGLWMSNLYLDFGKWNFQFLVVPDFKENVFAMRTAHNWGAPWELDMTYAPEVTKIVRVYNWRTGNTDPCVPVLRPYNSNSNVPEAWRISDTSIGGRLGFLTRGWEIHLSYYYTYPKFPIPFTRGISDPAPGNNGVPIFLDAELLYTRIHIFGANFEKTFLIDAASNKSIVVRGEMTYTLNQYIEDFQEVDNQSKHNVWNIACPIIEWTIADKTGGQPWTLAVRLDTRIIENYHSGLQDLPTEGGSQAVKNDITFSVLKFFYHMRVFTLCWVAWDVDNANEWLHMQASYDFTDKVKGLLQYNQYFGKSTGLWGGWRCRDNVSWGVQYNF